MDIRALVISLTVAIWPTWSLAIDGDLHDRIVELKKVEPSEPKRALTRVVTEKTQREMRQRTKRVEKLLRSNQFKTSVSTHRDWLLGVQGVETESKVSTDATETAILFISASIPLSTLRNYASTAQEHNAVMIIKGMVGDDPSKLSPTLEFFREILIEDPGCDKSGCPILNVKIAVDPGRFAFYNVQQVPALVLETHSDFMPICQGGSQYNPIGQVVYGDAAITDLIMLSKKGGNNEKD